jgi:hypothetical protein
LWNDHDSYLLGVLIVGAAWILFSMFWKNYRAEIRWGTLIFVPPCWTPPALFNLDRKLRVGNEDFLWARLSAARFRGW